MADPKHPHQQPTPDMMPEPEKKPDPYAPVTGHPEVQQPFPDENDPNYGGGVDHNTDDGN